MNDRSPIDLDAPLDAKLEMLGRDYDAPRAEDRGALPPTVSECCSAPISASLSDGVLTGSCSKCFDAICRRNPRTGAAEWLDNESPWSVRDDLRPMPVQPVQLSGVVVAPALPPDSVVAGCDSVLVLGVRCGRTSRGVWRGCLKGDLVSVVVEVMHRGPLANWTIEAELINADDEIVSTMFIALQATWAEVVADAERLLKLHRAGLQLLNGRVEATR